MSTPPAAPPTPFPMPNTIHHPTLSTPSHRISTHHHPDPSKTLLPLLKAHLPHTLPLARRLQFATQTPYALSLATFAPPPPPAPPAPPAQSDPSNPSDPSAHLLPDLSASRGLFAALYTDRSRAPETEAWVYVSVEADVNAKPDANERGVRTLDLAVQERARRMVLALLEHVRRVSFAEDGVAATAGVGVGVGGGDDAGTRIGDGAQEGGGGAYLRAAAYGGPDPRLLLVGSIHRATLEMLTGATIGGAEGRKVISGVQMHGAVGMDPDRKKGAGEEEEDEWGARKDEDGSGDPWFNAPLGVVRGHTCPYAKFVFPPGSSLLEGSGSGGDGGGDEDVASGKGGLPEGMRWTRVREDEFALVMSRTAIPRKARTLRLLPDVGIRLEGKAGGDEGRLIAWGFLGVDSSLTSLHVEEEFRGKGLAKTLTKRVFGLLRAKEEVAGGGGGLKCFVGVENGLDYLHSDVARDNKPSVGVAEALGGVDSWDCFWTWIDLEAVQKAVAGAIQVLS